MQDPQCQPLPENRKRDPLGPPSKGGAEPVAKYLKNRPIPVICALALLAAVFSASGARFVVLRHSGAFQSSEGRDNCEPAVDYSIPHPTEETCQSSQVGIDAPPAPKLYFIDCKFIDINKEGEESLKRHVNLVLIDGGHIEVGNVLDSFWVSVKERKDGRLDIECSLENNKEPTHFSFRRVARCVAVIKPDDTVQIELSKDGLGEVRSRVSFRVRNIADVDREREQNDLVPPLPKLDPEK